MATYNVLKTSSLLLSIILVMSCASKQQIIENDIEIEQYPKLLFLNYRINKGENGEKTIALINQKTTVGKLKNKSEKKEKTSFGDLECIILDKDLNQIGLHAIKNPLKKIVEYINDFGNFEKKILDLDSAQFSIRLQLQSKVKYVRISELTKEGTKKHITTEIK